MTPAAPKEKKSYECPDCAFKTENRFLYASHRRYNHPAGKVKAPVKAPAAAKTVAPLLPIPPVAALQANHDGPRNCPDCTKWCKNRRAYQTHMLKAHGKKNVLPPLTNHKKYPAHRVEFTPDQVRLIVDACVLSRIDDPCSDMSDIFREEAFKVIGASHARLSPSFADEIRLRYADLVKNHTTEVPVPLFSDKPVDTHAFLQTVSTVDLVVVLAQRLGGLGERVGQLEKAMWLPKEGTPPSPPINPPAVFLTSEQPKKSALKVGILGLLNDQFQHIVDAIGDRAKLYFVDRDRSKNNLPTLDFVVCSKFIPHSKWNSMREQLGTQRVRYSGGGLTQMREAVELILKETHS